MEVSSGLSTSKVTVEYYDPAGVFPLLSAQLQARLPLRNLHWKSATRPLRSIDSLHVDLIPEQSTRDADSRPPTSASQDSLGSQNVQRNSQTVDGPIERPGSSLQASRPLPKGRRHQVPGLRRTPYLKVYLLRCDDSDMYRTTCRQQIRDWIRTNTPPSKETGKKTTPQEKHDAFEWLILHVVVPNTPSNAQPRFSGSLSNSTGTAKDRSNKTKWPGGKSNTVFEKIRSDFNSSGSHALDRVAQVRVQSQDVPLERQFAAPVVATPAWPETPAERNSAWLDVVAKFKTLILESFDQRVNQYEEDIRERDAQRTLPGWNFCTFFVLKEGLARSFEGVGLVEDAIVLYDELSIGLDTSILDKADPENDTSATTFLGHTENMLKALREVVESEDVPLDVQMMMRRPIDEYNKPYREMILQNNISVFDFRCYIFARQLSLLLRLGKASFGSRQTLSPARESRRMSLDGVHQHSQPSENSGDENLGVLADICKRALVFATTGARVLRSDLSHNTAEGEYAAVQNFVCSWSTAVAEQILAETASSVLQGIHDKTDTGASLRLSRTRSHNNEVGQGSPDRPTRSSSLSYRPKSAIEPPYAQNNGDVVFDRTNTIPVDRTHPSDAARYGLVELAIARAALILFKRRLLEGLGKIRHWASGWSSIELKVKNKGTHGSNEHGDSVTERSEDAGPVSMGLCVSKLVEAVTSLQAFHRVLEAINKEALAHYLAANQTRSSELIYGDLAIIQFDTGDYAGAVKYFERITPTFGSTKWNRVEVAMLRMQAECLRALNRKDEYVRILLIVLQKVAARAKSLVRFKNGESSLGSMKTTGIDPTWLDDSDFEANGILSELIAYSQGLPYDVSVPMTTYFTDVAIDTCVDHDENHDGFSLPFRFRHLLEEDFTATAVQVKLVGTSDEQKRDLLLDTGGQVSITRGLVECSVHAKITTYGSFLVEKVVIRANKILFLYEPLLKPEPTLPLTSAPPANREPVEHLKMTRILCFPRADALEAKLSLGRSINLGQARLIDVWCCVGANDVQRLEIRLRAASAGLRLHTSEVSIIHGDVALAQCGRSRPGIIELGPISPFTTFRMEVPYEVDSSNPEILIRIDAEYTTSGGVFQFFDHTNIPIELPLDVNVQDSFKPFALFSTFNIRAPDHRPLWLLSAALGDSGALTVQGPHGAPMPRLVVPKKATNLQYIVKQKEKRSGQLKDPLTLALEYQCFDEQIRAHAERAIGTPLLKTALASLKRLVIPFFINQLMSHIRSNDWTQMAYQDRIPVAPYEDFGWGDVLDAALPARRYELQHWLEHWHGENREIRLGNIDDMGDSPATGAVGVPDMTRKLTISVSVPTVQLMPTASLRIRDYARTYLPTDVPWPAGVAKQAVLSISHTRAWGDASELKSRGEVEQEGDAMRFVYEIDCHPDIWLVGGPRRGFFSQREGEQHALRLELLLVPLRKGDWAVPSVDVRAVTARKQQAAAGSGVVEEGVGRRASTGDGADISCETYYEEQFMRVLVVPGVRSTTTGLMEEGEGLRTTLLDSRQMEEGA